MKELTVEDCYFIIEALDYTVLKFENYTNYPSYEFKQQRVRQAKDVRQKIRDLRDMLK